MQKLEEIKECPDCASQDIARNDKDQVICRGCGLIYEPYVTQTIIAPKKKTRTSKKQVKSKGKKKRR